MLHQASDIATSTSDPYDGGCPADTETALFVGGSALMPQNEQAFIDHRIEIDRLNSDNARLKEIEVQLRAAIREANHKIERMLKEIDVMVAKLHGVAK